MSDYLIDPAAEHGTSGTGRNAHVEGCEGWYQLHEQRNAGRLDARRYGGIIARTAHHDWTTTGDSDLTLPVEPIVWDLELYDLLARTAG